MFNIPVKFFPKDVISGKAEKPGDEFTAFFITGECKFVVMADHFSPACFYGELVR